MVVRSENRKDSRAVGPRQFADRGRLLGSKSIRGDGHIIDGDQGITNLILTNEFWANRQDISITKEHIPWLLLRLELLILREVIREQQTSTIKLRNQINSRAELKQSIGHLHIISERRESHRLVEDEVDGVPVGGEASVESTNITCEGDVVRQEEICVVNLISTGGDVSTEIELACRVSKVRAVLTDVLNNQAAAGDMMLPLVETSPLKATRWRLGSQSTKLKALIALSIAVADGEYTTAGD